MNFDKIDSLIDHFNGQAGYASVGNVDALVYSALEVHEILNTIQYNVDELRETYAKPVEMTSQQQNKV